jgi:serine/threonine-protein kinase
MRNDLLRALAGQRVEATPVMGDAEKTAIIGAPVGGYGYGPGYRADYGDDDGWDEEAEEQERRRRKRRIIALVAALAVLLIGGVIALFVAMSGDDAPPPAAQVQVPAGLIGQTQEAATATIEDAGLQVGDVETRASTEEQEGLVIETTPAGGVMVDQGSEVDLVVGAGPNTLAVPNVVGLDEDRARDTLEAAGFTGSIDTRPVESLEDEGTVVSVSPEEGQQAAPDSRITLGVSTGTVDVPDVRGKDQATATQELQAAGFSNVTVEEVDSDRPVGTVLASDPAPGTPASAQTRITLQVSGGTGEIAVPNVRGLDRAAAQQALQSAGFTNVQVISSDENDPGVGPNQAIGTEPPANTMQEPDTEIVLIINPPA